MAAKKKRWPWIVAAVVVFCGLPLGGCVALIGFGVNEINDRNDEIDSTVSDFFDSVRAGDQASAVALADGDSPCAQAESVVSVASDLGPIVTWARSDSIAFVERNENSTFSSNADPESLFIDGRPEESAAVVNGILETESGGRELQVLLSQPVSRWRICTITVR